MILSIITARSCSLRSSGNVVIDQTSIKVTIKLTITSKLSAWSDWKISEPLLVCPRDHDSLQNYSILSQERYQPSAKLRRLDKERGGGGPSPGPTLEAAVAYWRKQKEGESVWEWVGGTILLIASHPVRCFNGKYKYTEIQKVQNYKYEIGGRAPFF